MWQHIRTATTSSGSVLTSTDALLLASKMKTRKSSAVNWIASLEIRCLGCLFSTSLRASESLIVALLVEVIMGKDWLCQLFIEVNAFSVCSVQASVRWLRGRSCRDVLVQYGTP
jgi:hypothetical protein